MDVVQHQYSEVQVSQLGVYQTLEQAKIKLLQREKAESQGQLDEINAVIAAWTNAAAMVDTMVPMATKLSTGGYAAKAEGFARQWHAQREQAKNWKSLKARTPGQAPALERAEIEKINASREFNAKEGDGEGFSPSIAGAVGAIARFAYKDDIKKLQAKIIVLENEISAKEAVVEMVMARSNMDDYLEKVAALQMTSARLNAATLANREAQYLQAGDSLDRYARAHASGLKARGRGDLIPKSDTSEMFSTLMVIVAKVRAYLMVSRAARSMPLRQLRCGGNWPLARAPLSTRVARAPDCLRRNLLGHAVDSAAWPKGRVRLGAHRQHLRDRARRGRERTHRV